MQSHHQRLALLQHCNQVDEYDGEVLKLYDSCGSFLWATYTRSWWDSRGAVYGATKLNSASFLFGHLAQVAMWSLYVGTVLT